MFCVMEHTNSRFTNKINMQKSKIEIVGAQGPRMKLKGCSLGVGMPQATGPRKKAARGREEMNQGTL